MTTKNILSMDIYTDGAFSLYPEIRAGVGIVSIFKNAIRTFKLKAPCKTNNSTELYAILRALKAVNAPKKLKLLFIQILNML